MKRKRHGTEEIIRKLREGELLHVGDEPLLLGGGHRMSGLVEE